MNPIIKAQEEEITEYYVYKFLSKRAKKEKNKKVLLSLANEEKKHYLVLKEIKRMFLQII